ncbi:MAG: FliA/WhiG family RNA polymerase sigma factor [Planctomycetaceae bacterium]|nr:FliA/WhiG family RNA polymerase sigma factor [Planctomycetaceae bacterium]
MNAKPTPSNSTTTDEKLWSDFRRSGDSRLRGQLIERYLPLVTRTAQRLALRLPDSVEVDDLVSAGTFGLIRAVAGYDPRRGVSFDVYCIPRLRGAMLDELRAMDWVPRGVRSRARSLSRASETLRAALGRAPSDAELARTVGVDERELQAMLPQTHLAGVISINCRPNDADDDLDVTDIAARQEHCGGPLDAAIRNELRDYLAQGLNRTQRLVVLLYYFEGLTMKETGLAVDLSESRVSQMLTDIASHLRDRLDQYRRNQSPPKEAA